MVVLKLLLKIVSLFLLVFLLSVMLIHIMLQLLLQADWVHPVLYFTKVLTNSFPFIQFDQKVIFQMNEIFCSYYAGLVLMFSILASFSIVSSSFIRLFIRKSFFFIFVLLAPLGALILSGFMYFKPAVVGTFLMHSVIILKPVYEYWIVAGSVLMAVSIVLFAGFLNNYKKEQDRIREIDEKQIISDEFVRYTEK